MQLEGTDASTGISITRNSNNASPPYISLAKSRSGSVGGNTVIQDDDTLGEILFSGADGTDITNNSASISADIDGTPGGNDTPGRLVFSTTADGGTSPTERMRITASGQTLMTGSMKLQNSGDVSFNIRDTSANAVSNWFEVKTSGQAEYNCYKEGVGTAYPHVFKGYTTEYARIDAAGIKFNGDTATANGLDDYEQGSFTPTITYTSGASGVTYSGQQGRYTKIGDTCFINIRVNLSDKGTSSGGNLAFSSLPFTPSTNIVTNSMVRLDAVVGLSAGDDGKMPFIQVEGGGNLVAYWFDYGGSGNYTSLVHGDISNSSQLSVTGFYKVGDA